MTSPRRRLLGSSLSWTKTFPFSTQTRRVTDSTSSRAPNPCHLPRRRWQNYLNNDIKQGGWSEEEDRILLEGHKLHGNKWTEIARMVTGRTDNAVKNRHAVLVKKEEKKEEAARDGGSAGGGGKRKRRQTGDAATNTSSDTLRRGSGGGTSTPSSGAHATATGTQTSGGGLSGGSGSWRPKLSVKIPGKGDGDEGLASAAGSLPSAVALDSVRGPPPSLENLQTSASLTAAEIELLKQVQELISPSASGFAMEPPATGGRGTRSGAVPPQTPLETPTVDFQQVMSWILSVTPRAGASGAVQVGGPGSLVAPIVNNGAAGASATGGGSAGGGAAGRLAGGGGAGGGGARGPVSLESAGGSGQHSQLLRKLLSEKLSGSPAASPVHAAGARRSPRLGDTGTTPTGLDLANGIASGGFAAALAGSMPSSPAFTQSELNMLLNALGGTGDTPTSGPSSGGINPFGRADASNPLSPQPTKKAKK